VLNASNVLTQEGHVDPAVTSFFLYSMPDEHLGAVDHARYDSGVCIVYVSYICLVHKGLGGTRNSQNFDSRFGWVSN